MAKLRMWTGALAAMVMAAASGAQAASFDAFNPEKVATVIKATGAKGEIKVDEDGQRYLDLMENGFSYSVEFRDCDKAGKTCGTQMYLAMWDVKAPTLDQINRWNARTYICAGYATSEGQIALRMGHRVQATDTEAVVKAQHDNFAVCVDLFQEFITDPEKSLKAG